MNEYNFIQHAYAIAPTQEDLYGYDMSDYCNSYPSSSKCYGDSGSGASTLMLVVIVVGIIVAAIYYEKK